MVIIIHLSWTFLISPFISAEEINYKIKMINDVWVDDLANPESQLYIEREKTIVNNVKLVFLFFLFLYFLLATVVRYILLHFTLSSNLT